MCEPTSRKLGCSPCFLCQQILQLFGSLLMALNRIRNSRLTETYWFQFFHPDHSVHQEWILKSFAHIRWSSSNPSYWFCIVPAAWISPLHIRIRFYTYYYNGCSFSWRMGLPSLWHLPATSLLCGKTYCSDWILSFSRSLTSTFLKISANQSSCSTGYSSSPTEPL